jgi:hypothetical protein
MKVMRNGVLCYYDVRTGEYTPVEQGNKTPAPQKQATTASTRDYSEIKNEIQRKLAGRVEK